MNRNANILNYDDMKDDKFINVKKDFPLIGILNFRITDFRNRKPLAYRIIPVQLFELHRLSLF